MSTLAKISDTLLEQNKVLLNQGDSLDKTATSMQALNKNFSQFLVNVASDETDALETEAEARAAKTRAKSSAGGSRLAGIKSQGEGFLMGLGLPGMGAILGRGLLGGLVRGGLAYIMADAVAEYIRSQGFSDEISDAVGRGLTGYGILRIFGKRLGVVGLLGGALATEDNINATKQHLETLAESFETGWTKLGTWFDKTFGVEGLLPTLDDTIFWINDTFSNAMTGFNAFLRGDWDEDAFLKNIDDMGIALVGIAALLKPLGTLTVVAKSIAKLSAAAVALTGLSGAARNLNPGGNVPGVTAATKLSSAELRAQAGKLSAKQLDRQGLMKNKAGKIIDKASGQFVGDNRIQKAMTDTAAASGKFSKLTKFLKLPGMAYLFGAYDIYSILNSPGPIESKIAPLAGIISAIFGSGAGGAIGFSLGSFLPGPGNIIGGVVGAGLGYVYSDMLGKGLAQYLLGQKVDAFGGGLGMLNDMMNGSGSSSSQPTLAPNGSPSDGISNQITKSGSTIGQTLQDAANSGYGSYAGAVGMGGLSIGSADNISYNYDIDQSNNSALVGGGDFTASTSPEFGNNRR
jgi:hypothetical protein